MNAQRGKLLLIGFGPGHADHITRRARKAIQEADVIIGYNTYVDLIRELLADQDVVQTGMTEEVSRAREAVRQAELGKVVAVISSGDAGVYGMAGLVYEVLAEKGWREETGIGVEVIPGISAIQSCASLLGAPVMHDACTISLSDHLTPWETIARRVEAAAAADFVIALYNPRSGRRTRQIVETQRILLKYRSPETPVGLVKSAYRDRQSVVVTNLADMLEHEIGMLTTVIIGNSATFVHDGKMITPRGYQRKYTLSRDEQPLKPHERLRAEAEPWALHSVPAHVPIAAALAEETASDAFALAMEALRCVAKDAISGTGEASNEAVSLSSDRVDWLEVGVSPGVANKRFSPQQMRLLAEWSENGGELLYTPEHQIILRLPNVVPDEVAAALKQAGLDLLPLGRVAQVKACDFCDLEKEESIPIAEELSRRLDGLCVPKELKIGFNGCGMACYGAVLEDIGLVYRRGAFDLFLGGKRIGRNAHPGQRVAEGVPANEIISLVERIVEEYKQNGHPDERFHKFFRRTGTVAGFRYEEHPVAPVVEAVCGE